MIGYMEFLDSVIDAFRGDMPPEYYDQCAIGFAMMEEFLWKTLPEEIEKGFGL